MTCPLDSVLLTLKAVTRPLDTPPSGLDDEMDGCTNGQFHDVMKEHAGIMHFGFSYIGLIWLILLLVPNIIWTKNKPQDYESHAANENKVLLALERAGQFTVTPTALVFSDFNYKGWNFWVVPLLVSFLCMVLYEVFWIRYFRSEKTMQDFYRGILGVPVAGATLPIIAFFLLGIYGGNILMFAGSVILGIGHIGIHLQHRKEVYGPKQKKKTPIRILLGIIKGIGILLSVLICGTFVFFIAGRNINQIKHAIAYKDGVNEQIYVMLNDQEEYISIIGRDTSNPIIISLHGGPGAPTTYVDYCWQDYLTDEQDEEQTKGLLVPLAGDTVSVMNAYGEVYMTLPAGETVDVLGTVPAGTVHISVRTPHGLFTGFADAREIVWTGKREPTANVKAITTKEGLEFRRGPDESDPLICTLYPGTEVMMLFCHSRTGLLLR